jgi:hypothetical protein
MRGKPKRGRCFGGKDVLCSSLIAATVPKGYFALWGFIMRSLLMAAALAAAAPIPALAVENISVAIQNGGSIFACANGQACDSSLNPHAVAFGSTTVGDISILFTGGTQEFGPDRLSLGQVQITNNAATSETLFVAIGAAGYPHNAPAFHETASFTLDSGSASAAAGYWVDNADGLGGRSSGTDTPGVEIASFGATTLTTTSSFSFNDTTPFGALAPYSLSEGIVLTLGPHAELTSQGISMSAVPEPSTWLMGAIGFGLVGLLGRFGRGMAARRDRLATI